MREKELEYYYKNRSADEILLRQMLFFSHGHSGLPGCLYGDDGEMQCNACFADFICDTVQELNKKIHDFNMKELVRLGVIKYANPSKE